MTGYPHMVVVAIAKSTAHDDIAFAFDTDAQVLAAWRWLVENDRVCLDWRPGVDAPDGIHEHLHELDAKGLLSTGASVILIRRAVGGGLWGCEADLSVMPYAGPM